MKQNPSKSKRIANKIIDRKGKEDPRYIRGYRLNGIDQLLNV